jgi:hypothetical protein
MPSTSVLSASVPSASTRVDQKKELEVTEDADDLVSLAPAPQGVLAVKEKKLAMLQKQLVAEQTRAAELEQCLNRMEKSFAAQAGGQRWTQRAPGSTAVSIGVQRYE